MSYRVVLIVIGIVFSAQSNTTFAKRGSPVMQRLMKNKLEQLHKLQTAMVMEDYKEIDRRASLLIERDGSAYDSGEGRLNGARTAATGVTPNSDDSPVFSCLPGPLDTRFALSTKLVSSDTSVVTQLDIRKIIANIPEGTTPCNH